MAAADLIVELRLKDNFTAAMRHIGGFIGGEGGRISRTFSSIAGAVLNFRNAILGLAGAGVARAAVVAFGEQERAVAQFEQALKNAGKFTPEFSRQMQDLATSIQATGSAADEATLGAAKFLALSDRIGKESLPRATQATVDLAAAIGIDLDAAAKALLQTLEGNAGTLSRYGVRVDEAVLKSGDFETILAAVERKVGGADAALRQTTLGSLTALRNGFGELLEAAGEFIAEIGKAGVFDFLGLAFKEAEDGLRGLVERFKSDSKAAADFAQHVIGGLRSIAEGLAAVVDLWLGLRQIWALLRVAWAETVLFVRKGLAGWAVFSAEVWDRMRQAAVIAWNAMAAGINSVMGGLGRIAAQMIARLQALTRTLLDAVEALPDELVPDTAIAGLEAMLVGFEKAARGARGLGDELAEISFVAISPMVLQPLTNGLKAVEAEVERTKLALQTLVAEDSTREKLVRTFDALEDKLKVIRATAPSAGGAVKQAMQDMGSGLDVPIRKFRIAADSATALELAVRKVNAASSDEKALDRSVQVWEQFFNEIEASSVESVKFITNTIRSFSNAVADFVGQVLDKAFEGQIKTMRDVADIALDVLQNLVKQITQELVRLAVQALITKTITGFAEGGVIQGGIQPAPNIPSAATGGVFRGPQMVMVGDNPSKVEAAVPMPDGRSIPVRFEDNGGRGAGTVNVNFNIQAIDAASFQQKMATAAAQEAIRSAVAEAIQTRPDFRRDVNRAREG